MNKINMEELTSINKFVLKMLMFFKIYIPMEGRARPRLNMNNPLMYPTLLLTIFLTWVIQVVVTVIRVVCEGFYNFIYLYITTLRAGKEDQAVSKVAEYIKSSTGKRFEGRMEVNKSN
jgi:hypothetical protein